MNAEVAVVTGAAVQVQAEVEALARGDGVRNLHDPRRGFWIGFRVRDQDVGAVSRVQVDAASLFFQAETELRENLNSFNPLTFK